jgi:Flp pilus assembly protein TadG
MALLMVFVLGLAAFAVDVGYIVQTHHELQNAADSAALAGTSKLLDYQLQAAFAPVLQQSSIKTQAVNSAVSEAQKFAGLNPAGNATLNLNSNDVSVGYVGVPANTSPFLPWNLSTNWPNSVQVVVHRDGTSTASAPSLPLFFGKVLGTKTADVVANATATAQGGANITGFNTGPNGPNGDLLPITLDVATWNYFLLNRGRMPDGNIYDNFTVATGSGAPAPPANVTGSETSSQPDGIPEIPYLYPNGTTAGNFGLVQLYDPNTNKNGTPGFRNWIANGPSPSDLASFGSKGLQLGNALNPLHLKGTPGLKSTLQSDLAAIVGQRRVLPLYSTVTGNGDNADYTIVAFVGVTITSATGRGDANMQVTIQPIITNDPTATVGTPPLTGTPSAFVYRPLALTR